MSIEEENQILEGTSMQTSHEIDLMHVKEELLEEINFTSVSKLFN